MATSRSFKQLGQRFRSRAAEIDRNGSGLIRRVAIAAHREIVLATPVDTGRARSNWQVSLNQPITNEIPPYAPGSHLGIAEQANATFAISQGLTVLSARIPLGPGGRRTIYISNNVPYIHKLNAGSSRQAPANFVLRAVVAGVGAIQGVRLMRA